VETPPPSSQPPASVVHGRPPPTAGHAANRNRGTLLPTDLGAWARHAKLRATGPAEAYRIARGVAACAPAPDAVGYRLFWMRSDGACGSVDAPAERGRHVVVGRHEQCDLVLEDELAVSLRHVLVRVSALDDGFPVLNVLDLQTADGFELSDGSRQRCVVASGPVVFRIGSHALVALPNGVKLDDSLPSPVVDRADADPYVVRGERVELAPARARPLAADGSRRVSRITIVPESVQLEEIAPLRAPTGAGSPSNADRYEILLEARDGRRAAIRLTARDVEHGVLVGRADKCVDAGVRAVLTDDVSRVHALVIRERDGVFLYDAGSTNGITALGTRVRCAPLSDEGTEIALGGTRGAHLRWRAL
jgi:hypothetical protein